MWAFYKTTSVLLLTLARCSCNSCHLHQAHPVVTVGPSPAYGKGIDAHTHPLSVWGKSCAALGTAVDGAHSRDGHILTWFNTAFCWAEQYPSVKMPLAELHPVMSMLPSIPLHLKHLWCSPQCYSNAKMFAHITEILGIQASVYVCNDFWSIYISVSGKAPGREGSRMSPLRKTSTSQKFSSLTLQRPLLLIPCQQDVLNGSYWTFAEQQLLILQI